MPRTWLITGCSTGFGSALAEAVLARGDAVVATARDPAKLASLAGDHPGRVCTCVLDVTRDGDAVAAVALAEKAFGGLDVLVNNAGRGLLDAVEEVTPDEYRSMFETNVFGLIETTRAALPALRRSRRGRIVNFSSLGGIAGRAGSGLYHSTKFAVEGLSEALAQEVAPFGIAVIILEPGPFRTDFLGRSLSVARAEMPEYAGTAGKVRLAQKRNDGKQAGDPAKAVAVILKAVDADDPPLHLPLGEAAYAGARAKFTAFEKTMGDWEVDARATDF